MIRSDLTAADARFGAGAGVLPEPRDMSQRPFEAVMASLWTQYTARKMVRESHSATGLPISRKRRRMRQTRKVLHVL